MNTTRRFIFVIGLLLVITFIVFGRPKQLLANKISYPVKELGNCRDQKECYLYCQIPQNTPACWSYNKYILNQNVLGESTNSPEEEAKQHGITFPITELGNCNTPFECFNYCNQPTNRTSCFEFAKKKGLTKEEKLPAKEVMDDAKTELGCESKDTCMATCGKEENFDKCRRFAQKHRLENQIPQKSEEQKPPSREVIQKAQKELGCTSQQDCATYCNKPENTPRCMEFAKKNSLVSKENVEDFENYQKKKEEMMQKAKTTLGCDSPQSCSSFCSKPENMDKCSQITKRFETEKLSGDLRVTPSFDKRPALPCATDKECKQYCEKNPTECPGYKSSIANLEREDNDNSDDDNDDRKTFDSSPLSNIKNDKEGDFLGPNGCKTESECKSYCEKHPQECPGFPNNSNNSSPSKFPSNFNPEPKPSSRSTSKKSDDFSSKNASNLPITSKDKSLINPQISPDHKPEPNDTHFDEDIKSIKPGKEFTQQQMMGIKENYQPPILPQ